MFNPLLGHAYTPRTSDNNHKGMNVTPNGYLFIFIIVMIVLAIIAL